MNGTPVQLSAKSKTAEWPETLTADDLDLLGWVPVPIDEFVLKIHSRCNMACNYCYLYEMDDSSWEQQPGAMTLSVARQAAQRIADHAQSHDIATVGVTLHGGEPLLLGKDRLTQLLDAFREILEPTTQPIFRMQTNGLLLTHAMLETLDEFDVRVGVSLDGGRVANDRHRQRRNGVGTYYAVSERLNALGRGPFAHLFSGILATVDIANSPLDVYDDLRAFEPPRLDFLLPHGNWQSPPPAKDTNLSDTPYADWLITIFDHWFASPSDEPRIRLFDQIIRLLYGKSAGFESIGLAPVSIATIQTDGSFELVDTLKSAYNNAAFTGLNVFDHDLDALLSQPSVAARQLGANGVCETCRSCPVGTVCGGGYYPHRYRRGSGFLNPSAYCTDLLKLVKHITRCVK